MSTKQLKINIPYFDKKENTLSIKLNNENPIKIKDSVECKRQKINSSSSVEISNLEVLQNVVIAGDLIIKGNIFNTKNEIIKPSLDITSKQFVSKEQQTNKEPVTHVKPVTTIVEKDGYYGEEKTNIKPLGHGVHLIKEMKTIQYNNGKFGLEPSELTKTLKAIGITSQMVKDNKIDLGCVVACLIKSNQQLIKKVEELETRYTVNSNVWE